MVTINLVLQLIKAVLEKNVLMIKVFFLKCAIAIIEYPIICFDILILIITLGIYHRLSKKVEVVKRIGEIFEEKDE